MTSMGIKWLARLTSLLTALSLSFPAGSPALATTATGRFELRVPVVYYHRISCRPDGSSGGDYTCPAQFETQMTYLRDRGWRTITVDELADLMSERRCPERRSMVVSFDDGAADNYTTAAPILERHGMRGTFFVNAGRAGRDGLMSFGQMNDLVARGHAIGNHGLNHLSLPGQPADVLQREIEGAQQLLDAKLGFRPRTFAYPYGRYGRNTDTVIRAVAASGFELAFTVVRGAREASDVPLLSKRIRISPKDTGPQALARVEPYIDGCPPPTADISVALSKTGTYKGNNIYSATPLRSQTVRRIGVRRGETYRYWLRLQNDGQFADAFTMSATVSGPANDVRFLVAGVDVTNSMRAGTYTTPQLDPWSSMRMLVRITPGRGVAGDVIAVVVRAVPVTKPARVDTGRLKAVY